MGTAIVPKGKITSKVYGVVEIFFEDYRNKNGMQLTWYAVGINGNVVAEGSTRKELYERLGIH